MNIIKKTLLLLILIGVSFTFSACWDIIELDEIFIITAMAIDATENPDEFELTLEVLKTENVATSNSLQDSSGTKENAIIMKQKSNNLLMALEIITFNSSRTLTLHHNQILLIGKELAERGINQDMDFFLRARQPRLEISMFVVDGKADEILMYNPEQEITSSRYVTGMIKELEKKSKSHKIRVLDFINDLLSPSKASALPLIKKETSEALEETDSKEKIVFGGVAFFKEGKMVASGTEENIPGLFLARDNVHGQILTAYNYDGEISFCVNELKHRKHIKVVDGKLKVTYKMFPTLQVAQVIGFGGYDFSNFLKKAEEMAEIKIKESVLEITQFLKDNNVDALEYATYIYKRNPKLWKQIESNWDYIFKNAEIKVEVKVNIPNTGKTAESIEMEQSNHEN